MSDADPMPFLDTFDAGETLPEALPDSPWGLFRAWFDAAQEAGDLPNPNAMTLATVDQRGRPAARVVLCKKILDDAAAVVFFTNYQGDKGRQLEASPYATAVFHWDHADRQVRLSGPVTASPDDESDAYFASRHWIRRLGAWASEQSRPIASRDELLARVAAAVERLGLDLTPALHGGDVVVPRPHFWGGYRIWAERVELWCGGAARVHDRAVWTRGLHRSDDGYTGDPWVATRLQP